MKMTVITPLIGGLTAKKLEIEASRMRSNPQKQTIGRKHGGIQSRSRSLLADPSPDQCFPMGIIPVANTTLAPIGQIFNDY